MLERVPINISTVVILSDSLCNWEVSLPCSTSRLGVNQVGTDTCAEFIIPREGRTLQGGADFILDIVVLRRSNTLRVHDKILKTPSTTIRSGSDLNTNQGPRFVRGNRRLRLNQMRITVLRSNWNHPLHTIVS